MKRTWKDFAKFLVDTYGLWLILMTPVKMPMRMLCIARTVASQFTKRITHTMATMMSLTNVQSVKRSSMIKSLLSG